PAHYALSLHDALPIYNSLILGVASSQAANNSAFVVSGKLWLYASVDLFTIPSKPGTAIDNNSLAKSANVRMPPMLNSKSSFSGKDRKSTRLNSSHVKI